MSTVTFVLAPGNYGVSTKRAGNCSICYEPIHKGDLYLQLTHSSQHWPKLHQSCLLEASTQIVNKEEALQKKYETFLEREAINKVKQKAARKKVKEKQAWKKSIIKESLKLLGVCVSKISITNPADWGSSGDGSLIKIAEKTKSGDQWAQPAFFYILQKEANVRVIHPITQNGDHETNLGMWGLKQMTRYEDIPLADPDAIKKISEAMDRQRVGDWSPYLRKTK